MSKQETYKRIESCGIIAVVRSENSEQALNIAKAVLSGGIDIVEITLTVPGAIEVIKELSNIFKNNEVLVGAGTVLDPETARAAILAGAKFVVSPHLNAAICSLCYRYQKLVMPGAMTMTEILKAMECGADIIKIFPGSVLGTEFIKAIKGPLPYVKVIPTGGVSLDNVDKWIKAGCIAVGVGSELTQGAKTGNYLQVTETAKKFVSKIKEARAL